MLRFYKWRHYDLGTVRIEWMEISYIRPASQNIKLLHLEKELKNGKSKFVRSFVRWKSYKAHSSVTILTMFHCQVCFTVSGLLSLSQLS